MNVLRQNTSVISKLRVEGERLDPVSARLHFERLFGADNFLPAGLPPRTIVCIKTLVDPAPRTLPLNGFDVNRSTAWRNSVTREIDKLYRRAFRPIRETVPALAESVVFADHSELLACLASDWCGGLLAGRWWWRSLFPYLQHAQTVPRIWIESAEFAPPALQLLAKQGQAVKFAIKFQPQETRALLRRIIRVFNLEKLQAALSEVFEEEQEFAPQPTKVITAKKLLPSEDLVPPEPLRFSAPWVRLVPETAHPALSFEQQSLLGIALTLARSPGVARTAEFARLVKIFRSEFEIARTVARGKNRKISKPLRKRQTPPPPVLHEAAVEPEKPSRQKAAKILEEPPVVREKPVGFLRPPDEPKAERPPAEKTARKISEKIIFEDVVPEKKFERQESEKETRLYRAEKREFPETVFSQVAEEAETEFEFIVETRFGGIFYLLNFGLYLKLYRDFTEPLEAEVDLNIWDFVALLGLEFLGPKIGNDPAWKLLEQLAGRANEEEPGREFAPPDEWRIAPEWLETFQTGEKWLWTKARKRLVVRHPAGFRVVDVLLLDARSQLESELKIYGKELSALARGNSKGLQKYRSPSENWLKNLFEYARARLLQALNVETQEQLNALLFERKARISVTATHFDVNFNLADIAFEVRLSGLDRDPGWIPAAGKFVTFHFI